MIPRLGFRQGRLLVDFHERGFRTVAAPLYYADLVQQLPLTSNPGGIGIVLDPTTHIRELPREKRSSWFRQLSYGDDPGPFDPEAAQLSDAEIEALACEPLDAQRLAGATLMLTTYHVAGPVGSRGRDLELQLAEIGITRFRDQRYDEPHPNSGLTFNREIYATVATSVRELRSPEASRLLAEAYLELDCDGYWVKLLDFDERSSLENIEAAGRFFHHLREGRRPLVACGPGQLCNGFLVDEISVSLGVAGHERFKYPQPIQEPAPGDDKPGRSRPVYSSRLVRSIMSHDERLSDIFARAPCRCGAHPAGSAPTGFGIDIHTARCRADDAKDALDGSREERREWLTASAERAREGAGVKDHRNSPLSITRIPHPLRPPRAPA